MSIRESWIQLRSNAGPPGSRALRLRLLHTVNDLSVYASVCEADHALGMVIEIPQSVQSPKVVGHNGKRVTVSKVVGEGVSPGHYAVVVGLRDSECEDLFALLCDHLLGKVSACRDAKVALALLVEEIDRWRRFMDRHTKRLDRAAVIGLIGELAVLERLANRIGKGPALAGWRAPSGSIRDFELADMTVEAKAYSPSHGGLVHINNPLQLEPEAGKELLLACQEVASAEASGERLPDHVARVRTMMGTDPGILGDFDRLLADSGYLAVHDEEYRDGYLLGVMKVFRVAPGFPRIAPESVPLGVQDVRFGLLVSSLGAYEIDPDSSIGRKHIPKGRDK
jgi:hypothetical protein